MKFKQVIILKINASKCSILEDNEGIPSDKSQKESKGQIYFLVQKSSSSEDFRFSLFRKVKKIYLETEDFDKLRLREV